MRNIILDLCGGTGAWSKPYKDSGKFEVVNITHPFYDVKNTVIDEKKIIFISIHSQRENITIDFETVYGVLSAPPCTFFSLARTRAKKLADIPGALSIVNACLCISQICMVNGAKFWALENPRGKLRKYIGVPAFNFSPEEYGEKYTKSTDLWGYFNIPKKSPRILTEKEKFLSGIKSSSTLEKLPADYILPNNFSEIAARRAITPHKFAEAFFKANSKLEV